jgi:ribosomal protein S27E
MKYKCPNCGTIYNFNSNKPLKRCGKCNFIIEDVANEFFAKPLYCVMDCNRCDIDIILRCELSMLVAKKYGYDRSKDRFFHLFYCPDCKRMQVCLNVEETIECVCGNVIKNPFFEKNLEDKDNLEDTQSCNFIDFIGTYIIGPLFALLLLLMVIGGSIWLLLHIYDELVTFLFK